MSKWKKSKDRKMFLRSIFRAVACAFGSCHQEPDYDEM